MNSQINKGNTISIRKGEIITVHGDLTWAHCLTFRLENDTYASSGSLPTDDMLLDFHSIRFGRSVYKKTVNEYTAQILEGKFTGKSKIQHWLKSFGLAKYASKTLIDLPQQARYRLLFLTAIARPVGILKMANTQNFEDFAEFLLDVKRFFRDHKLRMFCPAFVVLEKQETPQSAILADGIIMLERAPQMEYQSLI